MEPINIIETYTSRGGKIGLIVEGFRFRVDKRKRCGMFWRCTANNCKSRCTTDDEHNLVKYPTDHNHEKEDEKTLQLHLARSSLKESAGKDMHEHLSKLIGRETERHRKLDGTDAKRLKNSIYRARQKVKSSTGMKILGEGATPPKFDFTQVDLERPQTSYQSGLNISTMSSPKRTDQESMSSSEQDGESTQDSESVKVKDEPADTGYEEKPEISGVSGNNSNNSNSNSRSSSPCPPVHFGSASPAQGRDSPSQGAGSGPPTPSNDYGASSIRTQLQGSNTGKKTDTVQNIVEGLLKKNATLLAMSDTESLRPQRRHNNGRKDFSYVASSAVFPVSSTSQARLVQNEGKKLSQASKPMLLRPKSPTKKCESILRDKSQLSYSLMESAVGEDAIEKMFKVQHHELVCAVSSKPYIFDKVNNEKKVVASLDNNYFWCNFCSFSSSNKSLITNHIMDHRFSCKFCPYESFCRSDVLRHMGKMHEEFEEMSSNLSYCTFLSDYIRCKTRADGKENNEPTVPNDEDVGDLDNETMASYHAENLKRKREREESMENAPAEKWAKMDSPDDSSTNGPRSDRPGKSRKSQNPRRHPQVNEKDYDTFEMEVEEIDENENGDSHEKVLYPSSSHENSNDHRSSPSMGSHMQLIPSLQDEGPLGYSATHVSRPTPPVSQPRAGRPPTYQANNRGGHNRSTQRSASASSLYWSCGYCDFQSSSQAEIKEHSNRTHPGKPHRLKATDSIGDTGRPPDEKNIVPTKDKTVEAEDNLASSPFGREVFVSCVNMLDKSEVNQTGKSVSDEGPHDMCVKNCNQNSVVESVNEKSQKQDDDYRGSFSKFSALNMSPISDRECSGKCSKEKNDGEDDSGVSLVEKDKEASSYEDKKTVASSSLKLTFRMVGSTTVCSLKDGDEIIPHESETSSIGLTEAEDSMDKTDLYSKQLEEELVDSSSDSDSDESISNAENDDLSAHSIIDEFVKDNDENESQEETTTSDTKQSPEAVSGKTFAPKPKTTTSSAIETTEERFPLSFVPVRSAAVKAMTKMKPVLKDEVEENEENEDSKHHSGSKRNAFVKPNENYDKSYAVSLTSKNGAYACHYCHKLGASPLRKVKSHLSNQHPLELPMVINVKVKDKKKSNIFYVCPFSSCNKLFSAYDDLTLHRSTHSSLSPYRFKEKMSQNSCGVGVSSLSFSLHVPLEAENIPDCRVMLQPLRETEIESLQHASTSSFSLNESTSKEEGERYECLYCTEYFSHSTLQGMKEHYAAEHSGQLLVLRDVEAKKEKLVSRIYACEEMECDFISTSRGDLDSHAKCHQSNNCTFVYECAGCGWYSSSLWTAKDHLKKEHSTEDNAYLIQMQLSVDENGLTSKKVLRSL